MIITRTPFRMSFFGGGTDMEDFFKEYGGAVLSTSFDKYCYVNVRHLPRFFDYTTELSYSKIELDEDISPILKSAAILSTGLISSPSLGAQPKRATKLINASVKYPSFTKSDTAVAP